MRSHLLAWDLVAVGLFVVMGRRTHQEGMTLAGILATAAPFATALATGWLAALRWNSVSVRGGVVVAAVTIAGGILLRRFVAADGTAAPFVVVASLFLLSTMLGWRFLAGWSSRRRSLANRGLPAREDAAA